MEHKLQRNVLIVVASSLCLLAVPASADTYRWKDKEGKLHYGAAVPAEYAEQPYDVLNSAGMVIEHVEDTTESIEEREERNVVKRKPLFSDEERQRQSDRLLVIQYQSEADVQVALELEIAQLGYDYQLINQSYDSTTNAIRDQIRQAADQQRGGSALHEDQQKQIDKLYRRLARDQGRLAALDEREAKIRDRFKADLERYRRLTNKNQKDDEEQLDQG
jgi:chromosome segregation ATPase